MQVVERAYGSLEMHHEDIGEVKAAGKAILGGLNLNEDERIKPKVVSNEIIRSVSPYQSQVINKISLRLDDRPWGELVYSRVQACCLHRLRRK